MRSVHIILKRLFHHTGFPGLTEMSVLSEVEAEVACTAEHLHKAEWGRSNDTPNMFPSTGQPSESALSFPASMIQPYTICKADFPKSTVGISDKTMAGSTDLAARVLSGISAVNSLMRRGTFQVCRALHTERFILPCTSSTTSCVSLAFTILQPFDRM